VLREDVDSIKDDDWLTDNVRTVEFGYSIAWLTTSGNRVLARVRTLRFYGTPVLTTQTRYLEREELTGFPKASIVLLRPSMSYMLMNSADPLTLKEVLPNFDGITHVFLPINDNVDVTQAEGGSHWSLLLVSIIDGVSFHYDSMSNSNDREARSTTIKLEHLLGRRLKYIAMTDSPQQSNGSDCGVFVCVLMKHLLLKRLLKADASRKISMSMKDAHVNARDGRKLMLRTIEDRKREGEKRRS
jgi:sentrin-specific protease 8